MRAIEFLLESRKLIKLRESAHKELCYQITLLEKSFNQDIEPGKEYIPVPIYIVHDHMDMFTRNKTAQQGEFCKLIKINDDTFEFKDKAGAVVEWPNQKKIGISYMTTLIAHDVAMYNKIRTMLALIFNLSIPPSSEKE